MKPLLIGEAPSRTSDPKKPFHGASGTYLAKLAGLSGVIQLSYEFRLRNILQRWPGIGNAGEKGSRFPIAKAKRVARKIPLEGIVILAGRRVAKAFGLDHAPYFTFFERGEAIVAVIPHPSGANRFWNDPENRVIAAKFLRGVLA